MREYSVSWRNIVLFTVFTLGIGNLAGLHYFEADGLGGLLFILSPAIVALTLRFIGGDGWSDFGWEASLRTNAGLYLGALLLFPVSFALALGIGWFFGAVTFQDGWTRALPAAMAVGAPTIMLYALCEEIGWRGYLDPRLAALGVRPLQRFVLVGVVWEFWHLGYIFSQPDYLHLPFIHFWPLTLAATVAMATIYGVMRAITGSFWPAAIAHAMGNMLAWPLLDTRIVKIDWQFAFAARPEGLVVLGVLVVTAVLLFEAFTTKQTPQ